MSNKLCTYCMALKPHNSFSTDNSKADGLNIKCKVCVSIYQKERYLATRGTRLEYYVKGVGTVRADEAKKHRLNHIRNQFKRWCDNGGVFGANT